jgi:hypothetical protein
MREPGWSFVEWYGCESKTRECSFNVPGAWVDQYWFQVMPPLRAIFAEGSGGLARDPSPLTVKQIHSGHSLTDSAAFQGGQGGHLRAIINQIQPNAAALGKSTIPGSAMTWRWNNAPAGGAPDARADISDWELLVITEALPLNEGRDSPEWLRTWTEHAWENGNSGNGAPTLLYTTWTRIFDSPFDFRPTLDDYEILWEEMADYASANLPEAATVYIVPGHRLMMGLYDDIQAGIVPGVSDISAFFEDFIHLNGLGSYAVALLHLTVVHHIDPRGLPHSGYGLEPEPSASQAAYLQQKVWDVATSYERTGLSTD